MKDRHTKFGIYEKFGIKYYMLVEPDKKEIEIFQLTNSKYSQVSSSFGKPFKFELAENCHINIDLNNFWK